MASFSLAAVAKHNLDGTYDAEVFIAKYGEDCNVVTSTKQRTVKQGLESREDACAAAESWIEENLFPVVKKLPLAKP